MIKNIIFDLGGVFIEFNPNKLLNYFSINENDKQILIDNIFASKEWIMMDKGLLDEQDMYEIVSKRIPSYLWEQAHFLIFHWNEIAQKYIDVSDYAKELKTRGYNLFLLSNASKRVYEKCWTKIKSNELFDGYVVSAYVKMLKPDKCIYEHLLNKYSLNPNECVFIDDNEENVKASISCKMKGIVHNGDINTLKSSLESILETR